MYKDKHLSAVVLYTRLTTRPHGLSTRQNGCGTCSTNVTKDSLIGTIVEASGISRLKQ